MMLVYVKTHCALWLLLCCCFLLQGCLKTEGVEWSLHSPPWWSHCLFLAVFEKFKSTITVNVVFTCMVTVLLTQTACDIDWQRSFRRSRWSAGGHRSLRSSSASTVTVLALGKVRPESPPPPSKIMLFVCLLL